MTKDPFWWTKYMKKWVGEVSAPKDTDQFMVDIRYGHHYHYPGCLATVKPPGVIPADAGYRELSYGEIRALKTHDGGKFEPHACVGSLGRLRSMADDGTHSLEQDITHFHTSGCSECRAIADRLEKTLEQTAIEMAVAMSGRAVRSSTGEVPIDHDWVTPENMIGDNIVVGENLVLGIHARCLGSRWEYALTTWWYHSPTVVAVFERDNLWEVH